MVLPQGGCGDIPCDGGKQSPVGLTSGGTSALTLTLLFTVADFKLNI